MTALSSQSIRERLYEGDIERRLVVTPVLDPRQIGRAAVDVRLGSEFTVLRQTRMSGLLVDHGAQPVSISDIAAQVEETVDTTYVPLRGQFVLHPAQFVLTATLEYIGMPRDLMAYVIGRSSWGRLGLNIATATMVAPGFKGSITFEMVNLGTVPIALRPGFRIAQLVFHELDRDEPVDTAYGSAGSKYLAPIGPEFSKIAEDADWSMFDRLGES